jgi:hypothetical protein
VDVWQLIGTAPVNESVLVFDGDSTSSHGEGIGIAIQDSTGNWRSDEGTPIVYDLTHWMSLPEPPRLTAASAITEA